MGETEYLRGTVGVCSLDRAIAYMFLETIALLKRKYIMHSESLMELRLKENCETLMGFLPQMGMLNSVCSA